MNYRWSAVFAITASLLIANIALDLSGLVDSWTFEASNADGPEAA
jgi:hypothetical protein